MPNEECYVIVIRLVTIGFTYARYFKKEKLKRLLLFLINTHLKVCLLSLS